MVDVQVEPECAQELVSCEGLGVKHLGVAAVKPHELGRRVLV